MGRLNVGTRAACGSQSPETENHACLTKSPKQWPCGFPALHPGLGWWTGGADGTGMELREDFTGRAPAARLSAIFISPSQWTFLPQTGGWLNRLREGEEGGGGGVWRKKPESWTVLGLEIYYRCHSKQCTLGFQQGSWTRVSISLDKARCHS